MKHAHHITAVLVALLLMATMSLAQEQWSVQQSGTTETLYSVSAPAAGIATTVGDMGVVRHTTNGGTTWESQTALEAPYRGVSFCDQNNGVATGLGGTIVYTNNGGQTWSEAQSGWMLDYYAAYQFNAQTGFTGGINTVFQPFFTVSSNGWQAYASYFFYVVYLGTSYEAQIRGMYFFDANTGVAATRMPMTGEGAMVYTNDQGLNWTTTSFVDHSLRSVDFANSSLGMAVGDNGLGLITTNGGFSWGLMPMGTDQNLNGICMVSTGEAWAVGDAGIILHTTDGGLSWSQENSGAYVNLYGVAFVSSSEGYAVGEGGTILRWGIAQGPSVNVTLIPLNPPITIPAQGGTFSYTATLTNDGSSPSTFQAWIMVHDPDTTWYGPIVGPLSLTLGAGNSLTRIRQQSVPANAPAGAYHYEARVGVYPDAIWSMSGFIFTKLPNAGNGPQINNWAVDGEAFPGEAAISNRPSAFSVAGAYPNPFNPATEIRYQIADDRQVSLRVYDTAGRLVTTLVDGQQEAGQHSVTFDGSRLASGVYLYTLNAGANQFMGKVVLLK